MRGSDFLIPGFSPEGNPQFIGIRSGNPALYGAIVYTGTAVSAAELLERAQHLVSLRSARGEALRLVENYVAALQELQIGNLVQIESAAGGGFRLVKVQDRPPLAESKPRLPG